MGLVVWLAGYMQGNEDMGMENMGDFGYGEHGMDSWYGILNVKGMNCLVGTKPMG